MTDHDLENSKTDPVIRPATEEEAAAKAQNLGEPEEIEELGDMDEAFDARRARNTTVSNKNEPLIRRTTDRR